MRVLMITSEWPTAAHPEYAPFIVRQVEFLRRHGMTVDVLHVDGRKNPVTYWRRWREVRTLAARQHYDVVHAQWGQAALTALPAPAPLVITFRGSDLAGSEGPGFGQRLSGRLLRALSRFAAGRADARVVVSERLRRHLPGRPCHVIPSGLDLERFVPSARAEARRQLGLSLTRRLVLFAASPSRPVKRHALAVAAVEVVRRRFDAELIVAAGIPSATMPVYMGAADVLLLTSRHEGSPNVVKEALACNLPVVSVDVGDVRERLAGIEGCVVCDDERPETLAAGVCAVLERQLPIDGRSTVLLLDEHRLTAQLIDVYREAIATRRGRAQSSAGR